MSRADTRTTTGNGSANNQGNGNRSGGKSYKKNQNKNSNKDRSKNGGKLSFQRAMTDGTMKGVVITTGPNKSHMFKLFIEKLAVCAVTQKYPRIPKLIRYQVPIPDATFHKATKPDCNLWCSTIKVNHSTADTPEYHDEVKVTDEPLKEELMGEYQMKRKDKIAESRNFKNNQSSILEVVRGQLDGSIINKLKENSNFTVEHENGNLAEVLVMLRDLCIANDDGDRSFKPFKSITTIKCMMNMEMRNKQADQFKDDVEMQFKSSKAVCGRFPNGAIFLEEALSQDGYAFDEWCQMDKTNQDKHERRGDELNKAMTCLNGFKNAQMKHAMSNNYAHGKGKCNETPEEMVELHNLLYNKKNDRNRRNNDDGEGEDDTENAEDLITAHIDKNNNTIITDNDAQEINDNDNANSQDK